MDSHTGEAYPVMLLVAKSLPSVVKMRQSYGHKVGRLVGPRSFERLQDTEDADLLWAADNDCFNGFDPVAYGRMLDAVADTKGKGLFVTCPDVVGDAAATLRLFKAWSPIVEQTGAPVAIVLQDGMTKRSVPWESIDAVFVGGSTEWKLGDTAKGIVSEAIDGGLWVHMGRVNTNRRLKYAHSIHCDSVDGTGWSKWTDAMADRWIQHENSGRQTLMDWGT